jgi:hypothetical protein
MRDILLEKFAHDQRERRNIALRVALDDRDGRILEQPGVAERAKKSFAGLIEVRLRGDLCEADYTFLLIGAMAVARADSREQSDNYRVENSAGADERLRIGRRETIG